MRFASAASREPDGSGKNAAPPRWRAAGIFASAAAGYPARAVGLPAGNRLPILSRPEPPCHRSVPRCSPACVRSSGRAIFASAGRKQILMPTIDVEGVGRIAFPLLPAQVDQLVVIADGGTLWPRRGDARRSRGPQNLADRTRQDPYRRAPLAEQTWPNSLPRRPAASASSEPVAADFYKLLVYDAGSFFVEHRDTEKAPGMFATLMIVLPSVHRGGELVVRHLGREVVLDPHPEEPSEIGFAAFYADCVHEIRPIMAGCRVALVYNLRFSARTRRQRPRLSGRKAARGGTAARLGGGRGRARQARPPSGARLYAGRLSFAALKGRDAASPRADRGRRRSGLRAPSRPGFDRGERQRRIYRLSGPPARLARRPEEEDAERSRWARCSTAR